MRTALFVAAAIAAAAVLPPAAIAGGLSTAAAALFEATPFVLAGMALHRLTGQRWAAAFFGCGCGRGPSAQSIPAGAATWVLFGPAVAIARFIAAICIARIAGEWQPRHDREPHAPHLVGELSALLPSALLAGAVSQAAWWVPVSHVSALAQIGAGAFLAFAASPCGIGAAAVASALAHRSPLAATAFLCVAGIVDARVLAGRPRRQAQSGGFALAVLAAGLAVVGWRRGDALVHPAFANVMLLCAAVCAVAAMRHSAPYDLRAVAPPALMLCASLVAAPPPAYRATETTLGDAFPGEPLTFTGTLVRARRSAALVRYAITCCRADAAPVVVRLSAAPPFDAGSWLHAEGKLAILDGRTVLVAHTLDRIAPPADPFTYR